MAFLQQVKRSIPFLLVVACLLIPSMQAQPVKGDPGDSGGTISVCCGPDYQWFRALKVGPVTCTVTSSWRSEEDGSEYESAKTFTFAIGGTGDVNNDDHVNVLHTVSVGQHWGETGSPGWIPANANDDGVINILDMIIIGQHWTGPDPILGLPVFTMSNENITIYYEYDGYGRLIGASGNGTIEVSDGLGNTCTGNVTITYTILAGKAKPLRKTITVPYDYGDTSRFAGSLEPVPIMSPMEFVTDYQYNASGALLGGTTSVTLENVGAAGDVTAECKVSIDTCRVIFHMGQGEMVKLTAHLSSTALGGYSVKYIYWEWWPALVADIAEGQVDVERLFVALGITTTSLPEVKVGDYYEATLEATGGQSPYTWGSTGLPAGLTCSAAGVISGTPTESGDFSVTVTVTDSFTTPNTDQRILALFVCIVGDANMDGVVDTGDITKVKRIYFELDPPTPCADVNGDGLIDTGDITAIKGIYFGIWPPV